jgi:hypothetical protein
LLEVDQIQRDRMLATTSATAFDLAQAYKADCQGWKPPAAIPCGTAANLGVDIVNFLLGRDVGGSKYECNQ